MTHSNICKQIMIDWSLSKRGKLWLNPCGFAKLEKVKYGLAVGSSDLIGFEYVKGFPVFCSVEIKTDNYSKLSERQKYWLAMIKNVNGRAYVARQTKDGYSLGEYNERA